MSPALVTETPGGATKPSGELETCIRDILNSITKTALDPPLTASDISPDRFDALRAPTEVDDYHKTAVETAHKTILYNIAVSLPAVPLPPPPLTSRHRSAKIWMMMPFR
jgi:hypothetical protein